MRAGKHYQFNTAIFLAAFLLFQIEMIISKIFVPQFGGSYLVWGACMVFFQAALLGGYVYAHYAVAQAGMWPYRKLHILLYFLPLLVFPGRPIMPVQAHHGVPMVLDVFFQLAGSIGLVFFALSTAAIIIQCWLAASDLPERSHPYSLYAVSNLGSFSALLTYPFLFERYLDVNQQLLIWRLAYVVLLALHLAIFVSIRRGSPVPPPAVVPAGGTPARSARDVLRWFLFSAAGVIGFLSVTNVITYEITPAPLFWIIPLCIYLISFVFVFRGKPWCPAWIYTRFHLVTAYGVMLYFLVQQRTFPILVQVAAYCVPLFALCMFCQYNLILLKPRDERGLTFFYVMIAIGGFFGGLVTTWVMPLVTTSMVEYLLAFLVAYGALMLRGDDGPVGFFAIRNVLYGFCILMLWPLVFRNYHIFGIILLVTVLYFVYTHIKDKPRAVFMSLLCLVVCAPFLDSFWSSAPFVYEGRNYYGIYKVYEKGGKRFLMNGTTLHGAQWMRAGRAGEMLTYYHAGTPLYQVMTSDSFRRRYVGAVGLGVGTVAGIVSRGQELDFYELDPEVLVIAKDYFTFLKNSTAALTYFLGDARVNLKRNAGKRYDVLIIDAFSGDSVPTHLLTTDAIGEYRARLADDGVILFHVSNRYLDLFPVLFSNARAVGARACAKTNLADQRAPDLLPSHWVALTWDEAVFNRLMSDRMKWSTRYVNKPIREVRPWSDAYSSILPVLRYRHLLRGFKDFRPFFW